MHIPELSPRQPEARRHNRRRSCLAPGTSSALSSAAGRETSDAKAGSANSAAKKPATTTEPAAVPTAPAASNSGGHQFTLVNKCASAVKPVVVSTACGYSPRCADALTEALPSVGALGVGKSTTLSIDNFVGRIFTQTSKCGAQGEGCTMLEFNLDADSFYTPNSYDISNIQGFTQSISLGATGCPTVTCTSPSCSCANAYPIGDMTGCGNDSPVKACGKGNKAFTVVFCP
ncbi:hypothetical protein C8J57DRAFT_1079634 [Mycena rebaudengoi]|nr:hypothetical protein C8J57DRAFT_1079634 [Mycena rebaudengoi]